MIPVRTFIAKAEEIAAEDPRYNNKGGHDGTNGLCDCIGLIIGAIRRAGGQWRGMHGSNYAARKEIVKLTKIASVHELQVGEAIFKAYEPGQGGYDLPSRYEHGGSYYNGDLRDYYHVGIVESVSPLRIRHMTSPRVKMDTSLGKWSYHGRLKKIDYTGSGKGEQTMETVTIQGGNPDAPIRLRAGASTTSAILANIPQGSQADLLEDGAVWSHISWNDRTGYVKTEFVVKGGSGSHDGETISVSRAELEKAYDILGNLLGLRG